MKIISATGSDAILELLKPYNYEMPADIPYREGVIEIIKREMADILIVYENLSGDMDKYMFIEKVREIDSKIKILMITECEDENYKNYLYTKGVFDIFQDGKTSIEELVKSINNESNFKALKFDLRQKNVKSDKLVDSHVKNEINANLVPCFQKQQIIVFTGLSSSGKTTITVQIASLIAKNSKAKVLIIDFDTINSGVNQFLGIKRMPDKPDYLMPADKNSSLNYMVDAIDKRTFDGNLFEKYVIRSKQFSNLDILTGNKSLFVCENILNNEYYSRILEKARELYDFILIDTSSNVFIDATQFALINASKIFYIAEATYISLERTYRALKDIFPVWGVHNKKIQVIINKYHAKSISKTMVEEIIKEVPIAGYISFSEDYDESLNEGNPYALENESEYINLLEKLEIIPKEKFFKKLEDSCFRLLKRA